jgi:hypothetical protein
MAQKYKGIEINLQFNVEGFEDVIENIKFYKRKDE